MQLKGSKTEGNLKAAFAGESQANRRYLYFAAKADVEGQNDVAAVFRSTAEGETGHAHGHLEYLEAVGDPATGLPIGKSRDNLTSWSSLATRCIRRSGWPLRDATTWLAPASMKKRLPLARRAFSAMRVPNCHSHCSQFRQSLACGQPIINRF